MFAALAAAWILGAALCDGGTARNPKVLAAFARRNLFQAELVGWSVEELCIPGQIMDITTLSLVGEVARLHVQKHASA